MKKKNIFLMALVTVLILGAVGVLLNSRYPILKGRPLSATHKAQGDVYYCPMHPGYTSDRPGDCPICNMKLVKKEEATADDASHQMAGSAGPSASAKPMEEIC